MQSEGDAVYGIKKEIYELHGNFHQGGIQDQYDKLCESYETVYAAAGWPDPQQVADNIKALEIQDPRVLDMGCGTGLVGQYLKEHGVKRVDGVDGSDGMLEVARQKDAYEQLDQLFLGLPEELPQKYVDQYDVVSSSGLLAEGHATTDIFEVKLLACKQGGYIVFTVREEYLETLGYGAKMQELVDAGKMEKIKEVDFLKYQNMKDNPVGRFKPKEQKCFVYKKL